jgi:nucleoside-diphosphate-sugar epimerase
MTAGGDPCKILHPATGGTTAESKEDRGAMRIVVTGAAGFIGSHVVDDLLRSGHDVLGLDDLSTGRRENLAPEVPLVVGDVRNAEVCFECLAGCDAVVHLAGRNSVVRCNEDPRAAVDINVTGTLNVLDAASRAGKRLVVFASSSSVYGDPEVRPTPERASLLPRHPYAASKAAADHLAAVWWSTYGVPTIGLRFFNVFGPRQRPDGPYAAVIPRFIEAALEGRSARIHGDGLHARDFTYVANAVAAVRAALAQPAGAFGRVFNVACGRAIKINDLHAIVSDLVGTAVPPVHGPARDSDIRSSQADLSAAREVLGYEPIVPLEAGLMRTVDWSKGQAGKLARREAG